MSSRGRTDVETFQELDFRFSKVMPNSDDKFRIDFMNFRLGASFGICRVLQFEDRSKVFEVVAYEIFMIYSFVAFFEVMEYKNLLSRQVLGDFSEEIVIKGTFLEVAFQLEHEDRTSAVSSSCCSRRSCLAGSVSQVCLHLR